MYIHDSGRQYRRIKREIEENYGAVHLCGNCIHTTKCMRARIQWLNNKEIKKELMIRSAPFVEEFEIESLLRNRHDVGFVAVYKCSKYVFEGVKE